MTSPKIVKTDDTYNSRIIRNQSNNSKSNYGTVLFNTGLSRLIERLSLIKKLKLLPSPGKMSMLLKQMERSDSKSQSFQLNLKHSYISCPYEKIGFCWLFQQDEILTRRDFLRKHGYIQTSVFDANEMTFLRADNLSRCFFNT